MNNEFDQELPQCECRDCGRNFYKTGDNEEYCDRCLATWRLQTFGEDYEYEEAF